MPGVFDRLEKGTGQQSQQKRKSSGGGIFQELDREREEKATQPRRFSPELANALSQVRGFELVNQSAPTKAQGIVNNMMQSAKSTGTKSDAKISPREKRRMQRDAQDPKNRVLKFIKDNTVDLFAEGIDAARDTKVGRAVEYPFARAAEYLTPDNPLLLPKDQRSKGEVFQDGPTQRELQEMLTQADTTGNPTADKALDFAAMAGSYFFNPSRGANVMNVYNAISPLANRLSAGVASRASKPLAQRAIQEGAREGMAAAAYAVPRSLMVGEDTLPEIGRNVAIEGALGLAGGPVAEVIGTGARAGYSAVRDRMAFQKAAKDFIERINTQPLDTSGANTGPRAVQRLDGGKTATLLRADEAAANYRRGEQINVDYEKAIGDQYGYLKQSMQERAGVSQGGLIRDLQRGEVSGRYGRISNNPKWYRDFYAENGRKPTDKDLRELSEKHVNEGFDDEVGRIPPWKPKQMGEIDDELARIREISVSETDGGTLKALNDVESTLRNERVRMKQQLPKESQAMQAQSIPFRQADPNAKSKPITRQNLVNNLRKRFGVTIRTGRLGKVPKGVLGLHKVTPEVIRSRYAGDIQVIAHELGHNLDKRYGLKHPIYTGELLNLVKQAGVVNTGAYSPDQLADEGIAEFLRLYLTDPSKAAQLAPRYSKFFQTKAKDILPALKETQADVARWIDQGEAMQFEGQVNRTGKSDSRSLSEQWNKFYSSAVDKFNELAVAEKSITGKISDASESLYKKARLSIGAPKKAELVLRDLRQLMEPLDKLGYKMKDLGNYAAAKHANEIEKQGIESGFTQGQIDAMIRKYQSPEMDAIQQSLVGYNNKLLDMLVEGGVLSQKARIAMQTKHPNYVPFYRFFDEDISSFGFGGGGKRGFTDLANPVKRLKGSTRDIIDPIESMVKNTFAVVNAVERNKVGLELARLSKFDGAGRWVEKLDGKQSIPKENIVTVFENGERVQYQLDPELSRAMQQLDEETSNMLVRFLAAPSSTLRAGATLTPEFMLRNPIRDQFQAHVVSEFGYNPLIDLPRGLLSVLKKKVTGNSKTYDHWVSSGGGYGNYLSMDRNYLREQLRTLRDERNPWARRTVAIVSPKSWLNLLRTLSEVSEEATKVGEFRRGIRKGATAEEAAYQSRDLMDFGRVGSNIKQVNRVVAFLNANIQGKDRIARAFVNHPTRSTIRALTGITLPTIGVHLWNRDKSSEKQRETLDNAPQWVRDTFFLLSIPGSDVVARIPKPFDLAPLYANLPENIMRWMDDNDPQSMEEFAKSTALSLDVPFMLTGLTPWIENMTNYSFFTGGTIVPKRDQDLLPEDQYGPTTSLTAQTIGKTLGYSPYKVDNLVRGYAAGLGRYATVGSDRLLEATGAGNMPPEAQKQVSEWPVINAFTVDTTGGGKVMDEFYDAMDKITKQEQSNKKNEVRDKLVDRLATELRSSSRKIGELRSGYREIQGSYEMTPEEKRGALDALNERMKRIARETLQKVKEKEKAR